MAKINQKITPFLWFDNNAEEAMNFYISVFKNSKVGTVTRYGDAGPGPKGSVLTAAFELEGQEFVVLNGGPRFKFTEAISFVIKCETQEEIDYFWDKLTSDGGQESMCGWLRDKFGLSWQVVPAEIGSLLTGEKSNQAMQAIMQMKKIDLGALRQAAGRE
jgi:predicted 3-demethylubiquinone-9 3-methyltransferase (glyoxalase superfamily)